MSMRNDLLLCGVMSCSSADEYTFLFSFGIYFCCFFFFRLICFAFCFIFFCLLFFSFALFGYVFFLTYGAYALCAPIWIRA